MGFDLRHDIRAPGFANSTLGAFDKCNEVGQMNDLTAGFSSHVPHGVLQSDAKRNALIFPASQWAKEVLIAFDC